MMDYFDGERIKHFNIQQTTWELNHTLLHDLPSIQPMLISWIQEEQLSGRFDDRTYWKEFPGNKMYGSGIMVVGYRKLFMHQQYYFQLVLDPWCVDYYCCCNMDRRHCMDCDTDDEDEDEIIHFELALYGWKTARIDTLQPDNEFVLEDNMIPDLEWNRTSTRKERRAIKQERQKEEVRLKMEESRRNEEAFMEIIDVLYPRMDTPIQSMSLE